MTSMNSSLVIYAFSLFLIITIYVLLYLKKQNRNKAQVEYNVSAGLNEPASLHPKINSSMCIGAGSCISACPEGDVIGLINGKATLINPTLCIGHGACKEACPVNAISLVFGTKNRGIEIPETDTNFESNISGLYIAGELGGMGLIRNALIQGKQALDAISNKSKNNTANSQLDVVIVGAGPAGLAATLAAKEKGLNYVTIEQDSLGGTVAHFPRGKVVMTSAVNLPIIGEVKFGEVSKETLIEFWKEVESKSKIEINYNERMEDIVELDNGFKVKTSKDSYDTKHILLALGRRGTPRKLNVPGEHLPKVVYRLIDPSQYAGKKVLVVGGGDSALEAALSLADEENTTVSISYRSASFSRAKVKNRQKMELAEQNGDIKCYMSTNIKEITNTSVSIIDNDKAVIDIENDIVIVCAGGIPPTPFLKKCGINVEEKFGEE